jgi:REP element-mobilizing transposase RayT
MPEHLHLALDLNPKISISDFMKALKGSSSKWLADNLCFPKFRGWG